MASLIFLFSLPIRGVFFSVFFRSSATIKYNFGYKDAKQAPYDALYFLAETFLTLNKPDSAIEYFTKYQDQYKGKPPINVERLIYQCVNAKKNGKNPRM